MKDIKALFLDNTRTIAMNDNFLHLADIICGDIDMVRAYKPHKERFKKH